jgi:hypothetical protein
VKQRFSLKHKSLPGGRTRLTWKDNIKMDLRKSGVNVNWIHLVHPAAYIFILYLRGDGGRNVAAHVPNYRAHPTVPKLWGRLGQPTPSSAEVKERIELGLNPLSGPSWPVLRRSLPLP